MRIILSVKSLFILLSLCSAFSLFACKKPNCKDLAKSPSSSFMQELLDEHNYVRTKPAEYAESVVKPAIARFKDSNSLLYTDSQGNKFRTREGAAPYKELYAQLKKQKPLGTLEWNDALAECAQWMADDHARKKKIGHVASDGSDLTARVRRFIKEPYSSWGENIAYGKHSSPRELILDLLADDGVPNRGHRANILRPTFTHMGVGSSQKEGVPYGAVTVIDYLRMP